MIMLMSALYDFYSASSLNNNVQLDNVLWLRHIILILRQPGIAPSPLCCVLSGEAANTNFVVFRLTPEKFEDSKGVIRSCKSSKDRQPWLEPTS
jgi:hypothetical protein